MSPNPMDANDNGKRPRCSAKAKGTGKRCKRGAMTNGKCYMHGGPTPKGIASPHWKDGRYSKYMSPALRDASEHFLQDPDILSLTSNLALCDARIADALTKLDEGGGLEALGKLGKLRDEYRVALAAKNEEVQIGRLRDILDVIDAAKGTESLLRELDRLTEQRRRLVDTEVKRQTGDLTSITIERAFGFVDVILDIVARKVMDRSILAEIVEEVVTFRGPVEVRRLPAKMT